MLYKLERLIDTFNHTLELVRTIVPTIGLFLQFVIIAKLFGWI